MSAEIKQRIDRGPCGHRGESFDSEVCDLCGIKGQIVPIFSCDRYTKCVLNRHRQRQLIRNCLLCDDFEPT